jgi:CHAT domain
MVRLPPIAAFVIAAILAAGPAMAQDAGQLAERSIRLLAEANPPRVHEALDEAERARARGLPDGPALLDSKALQGGLGPDEIAVTFFLAEPESFRWVMSREHVVFDRIAGRAAIEKQATHLRDLLRAPSSRDEVKAVSAQLGAMLFDKISTADERPLIVVPHGVLHDVPFEELQLQGKRLIERHAVSYAPSLNALVQQRRVPANTTPAVPETVPPSTVPLALAIAFTIAAIVVTAAKLRQRGHNR